MEVLAHHRPGLRGVDPGALTPGLTAFAARYARANGGGSPPGYAAEGHDAASAILQAFRSGKRTGRDINAYLGGMDFAGGLTQRIRFTDKGEFTDARSYAYQIRNKTITLLGDSAKASVG